MKTTNFQLLFRYNFTITFLIIIIIGCNKSCPKKATIEVENIPEEVLSYNPYANISSLVYVNERNDSLIFNLLEKKENEIVSFTHKAIECRDNENKFGDLKFEYPRYKYIFSTSNGDRIKIIYEAKLWNSFAHYNLSKKE